MTEVRLRIEGSNARMLKISNNTVGDGADTIFTLPVEGIELNQEQLDELMGEYTHRSWFDKRRDGSQHPMPWFARRKDGSYELDEEYRCDTASIVLSGGRTIEFKSQPAAKEGEPDNPAAKITSLVLTPLAGGFTHLAFHMQVRPGRGKDNLALQDHQYRPITLTLGDAKLHQKKSKQQDLPLGDGKQAAEDFKPSASGEALDERMRARHPQGETMGEAANDKEGAKANGDSKAFEEGTKRAIGAHRKRPRGAIDGKTSSSRRRQQEAH